MKTVFEHIEHVKGKPHHVRRKVAVSAAILGSALIAFIWFSTNILAGSFAIKGSDFAIATGQEGSVATTSAEDTSGLAGAAAALPETRASSGPAAIEIVDTTPAPAPQKASDQTILPF
jgi:hypothetical protein